MPKSKNKRRKKNNGLAAVLIVLVVCAGLVLGGIFFYNGQLKPAASESEQIPLPSVRANRSTGSLRTWKIRA